MPSHKGSSGRSAKRKVSTQEVEDETDNVYRTKRDRNNEAVKKSRDKSKKKAAETQQRVEHLKRENLRLETTISNHRDRLKDLKEMFLNHAKSGNPPLNIDFDKLLRDTDSESEEPEPSTS